MLCASKDDLFGAINLIREIEKNPCLWNCTLKTYSRSDLTSIAWKKIADKVNDTEQNCRDRWKNIRTAFGRSIRPSKSGAAKSKKPYYLAAHLDFLRPFLKGSMAPWTLVPKDIENTDDSGTWDSYTEDDTKEDIAVNKPPLEIEIHQSSTAPHKALKRHIIQQSDSDDSYLEWREMKKQKTKVEQEEDSDWLFFRSLLPDFKKLTEKRKRNAKIKIATLLNDELDLSEADANTSKSYEVPELCPSSPDTCVYACFFTTFLTIVTSLFW